MNRVIAWAIALALLLGLFKLHAMWRNPWAEANFKIAPANAGAAPWNTKPYLSEIDTTIPSCADKDRKDKCNGI